MAPSTPTQPATSKRTAPHACPSCHTLWAVRGARHPSGAWIFLCRSCDWRRVIVTKDRRSRPRTPHRSAG